MLTKFIGAGNRELIGEVILSVDRLKRLAKKLRKVSEFAYDTETNTLRVQHEGEMELVGISICFGEHNAYYIPTGHFFDKGQLSVETVVKYLKPVFERTNVRIIGWNLKFDMHVLANIGILIKTKDIFDGMLARWITDENKAKGLKDTTADIYGVDQTHFDECLGTVTAQDKKEYGLKASNKAPFFLVRLAIGAPYAIADAYWTWRHYVDWQMDEIEVEEMETIFYKIMSKFLRTLFNMERRGAKINIKRLKEMSAKAEKDLADLEYKIVEIAGVQFKVTSSQQLGEILFGYKKLNKKGEFSGNANILEHSFGFAVTSKTDGGAPSTGESALLEIAKMHFKKDKRKQEGVKMIKLILKYKKLAKLKSAFIEGLIGQMYSDGKVHPSFNQVGTDSGRLSCSEPNLQQLPRPVEMDDYLSFEDWAKKNEIEVSEKGLTSAKKILENLEMKDGYPTGDLTKNMSVSQDIDDYLLYLTEWRAKSEEAIFWKYYEIRDCFIADSEDEVIMAFDYSNLEMRLLAHFSQDPKLMQTFINDEDAHGGTAVNMFSLPCDASQVKKLYHALRQIAKVINFLLMYGGGAYTLYQTLKEQDATDENGDPITEEKAQEYYDKYFKAYEGVAEFIKNQKKFAHRNELVYSLIGRKRRLKNINGHDYKMTAYEERLAVNSAIQGSGGDIMMVVQPKIDEDADLIRMNCRMILQVHDELVFVCPRKYIQECARIICDYMAHPLPKPLNIPLKAEWDWGETYANAK
jgi:DNA polymerase-1